MEPRTCRRPAVRPRATIARPRMCRQPTKIRRSDPALMTFDVELKTRAARRVIGLPAPIVQALKDHKEEQNTERETAANVWSNEGWVFANRLGRPVHPRVDGNEWKALLKAAGVRDARLHDARHTAATMLMVLGVPSRAVMEIMGWSHISLTARYQHMTSELAVTIADQVGGLYWPDDDGGEDGELPVPVQE